MSFTYGPNFTTVTALNEMRVALESSSLMVDSFDAGLDTVTKWNTPTSGGGGVAASLAVPTLTAMGTGTTAGGYSSLVGQQTWPQSAPGFIQVDYAINLEYPVLTNAYRFWGLGVGPTTPTVAAPLTDAIGFELYTDGKLYAVTYAGGTRFVIQDLSVATGNGKQPTDANVHSYVLYFRGDKSSWAINAQDNVAAGFVGGPGPNVNTLPIKFLAIANTPAPSASGVLTINGVHVSDTARNAHQISDGTYPWRKALVSPTGQLNIAPSDCAVTLLTTATATVCPGYPSGNARYLVAVVNNSLVAQSATTQIYDNPAAASGLVAASIAALSPSQIILLPGNGRRLTNGATAIASAAPNAAGIEIWTR